MIMMGLLFTNIYKVLSCSLLVILEFDGSFRPPRDPGFTALPARMATCGSSLHILHEDDDTESIHPVAIGARSLPISMDMTSAHVEYEGLILGLDYLCSLPPRAFFDNDNKSFSTSPSTLLIRGDCKTVIDQVSGRSQSRKLKQLHLRVMESLEMLKEKNDSLFSAIQLEHVPRRQNVLCDNLCGNLISVAAFQDWKSCVQELQSIGRRRRQDDDDDSDGGENTLQERKLTLAKLLDRCTTESSSYIKYSIRSALFTQIATQAEELEDYETLLQVGEQLARESKLLSPTKPKEALAKGVRYQIHALKALGLGKKALALERKHRFLLKTSNAQSCGPLEVGANSPSWDESIRNEWHGLLDEWWSLISDSELLPLDEGTPLWVESEISYRTK